jgi:transcriptional regulator with XRE-family HTH domain
MTANAIEGFGALDLRAMRRDAGLSQQRVAELAHCSIATVALLERGYRPNTSDVLPRIVDALNEEGRPAGNGTPSKTRPDGGDVETPY